MELAWGRGLASSQVLLMTCEPPPMPQFTSRLTSGSQSALCLGLVLFKQQFTQTNRCTAIFTNLFVILLSLVLSQPTQGMKELSWTPRLRPSWGSLTTPGSMGHCPG